MRFRPYLCVAIGVLSGVAAYLIVAERGARPFQGPAPDQPLIRYPARLDLGEHEIGEMPVARFSIENGGNADLVVDQIRANCSCSGMEKEEEGRYTRVDTLRLKPGEKADLAMRISVRGVPVGAQMINELSFRTNDPNHPTGLIEAVVKRVHGGVSTIPESVAFGAVPVGAQMTRRIDVRDKAASPRTIRHVSTNRPDRVIARLVPKEELPRDDSPHMYGPIIAQVEITVDTSTPDDVNAEVEIHLASGARRPDSVPVVGRIVPPVTITPSLPRTSNKGLVYSALCTCRSTDETPLALSVDETPNDLVVDIESFDNPHLRMIHVTWKPGPARKDGDRAAIRLRAKTGSTEGVLELPVLFRVGKDTAHALPKAVGIQPR